MFLGLEADRLRASPGGPNNALYSTRTRNSSYWSRETRTVSSSVKGNLAKDCWQGFELFKVWSVVCVTLEMAKLQSV